MKLFKSIGCLVVVLFAVTFASATCTSEGTVLNAEAHPATGTRAQLQISTAPAGCFVRIRSLVATLVNASAVSDFVTSFKVEPGTSCGVTASQQYPLAVSSATASLDRLVLPFSTISATNNMNQGICLEFTGVQAGETEQLMVVWELTATPFIL